MFSKVELTVDLPLSDIRAARTAVQEIAPRVKALLLPLQSDRFSAATADGDAQCCVKEIRTFLEALEAGISMATDHMTRIRSR